MHLSSRITLQIRLNLLSKFIRNNRQAEPEFTRYAELEILDILEDLNETK